MAEGNISFTSDASSFKQATKNTREDSLKNGGFYFNDDDYSYDDAYNALYNRGPAEYKTTFIDSFDNESENINQINTPLTINRPNLMSNVNGYNNPPLNVNAFNNPPLINNPTINAMSNDTNILRNITICLNSNIIIYNSNINTYIHMVIELQKQFEFIVQFLKESYLNLSKILINIILTFKNQSKTYIPFAESHIPSYKFEEILQLICKSLGEYMHKITNILK